MYDNIPPHLDEHNSTENPEEVSLQFQKGNLPMEINFEMLF